MLYVTTQFVSVYSGFRRDADEICTLLGYYAASSGNLLPTFRDNVSVPSSKVKKSKKSGWTFSPLKMGPIRCPETSIKDYHSTLLYTPEEGRSQISSYLTENAVYFHWKHETSNAVGCRNIATVDCRTDREHINALFWRRVEILMLNRVVHMLT
jgi:hypothetical protein